MAATTGGRGQSRGMIVGINVTPMVDVMLVLLVIMMVSATYIVSQSLKVDLPKASNSDSAAPSLAAVTITRDGAFRFNQEEVTPAQLVARLHAAHAANAEVSLIVTADRDAKHGAVVSVIDLAKTEGISHFAINVERRTN
jgi:biopolymer transport protein ExbD